MKICAVYKITNTVTNDFYIGSSKNVKQRWTDHKKPSVWKRYSNSLMYLDMQKYGIDKFDFEILEVVEVKQLKETEQKFIETLKPIYNQMNAKGLDIDKYKESKRKACNKYDNQLCSYNGELLTLCALSSRFRRRGIEHPQLEAKKYLLKQ